MFEQELEAQNNLCSFSQKTNYIVDWTDRPANKRLREFQKQAIPEEGFQGDSHHPAIKKTLGINREVSEKYNLRKYERKLETINQIEYPLVNHNIQHPDPYSPLSKRSGSLQSPPSPIFKKKASVNENPCRVVDVQFLNRKLELFQKKHRDSQKVINARSQNAKSKYNPRKINAKRSSQPNLGQKRKINLNYEDLEQIKKIISSNSRRYSVHQFRQVPHFHQLNL